MVRVERSIAVVVCVLTVLAAAPSARAATTTSNPNLPPDTGQYESAPGAEIIYGAPGLTIRLKDIRYKPRTDLGVTRTPSGPDEVETYIADLFANASVTGGAVFAGPISGQGQSVSVAHGKLGNTTGTFPTEMLQMNLAGVTPLGPYMIRESPTLASLGSTTIADQGGGIYRIDSFFDVFTELSIDGGQTWVPQSSGPTRLTLTPEPATAGILLLAGAPACLARRRR